MCKISFSFCVLQLFNFIILGLQFDVKQGNQKFMKSHLGFGTRNSSYNLGLWPSIFNLATKAEISANATCGENGRQEYCRMSENGKGRCGICDHFSTDMGKRHKITYAIDGSNKWWQSPPLFYGRDFEYVTITIDLKQVYQIAYVIIKAANSPRPGTWVLERSVDGKSYEPWQYFAKNDKECFERFGIVATKGKPHYYIDTEVICTSFFSRLTPLENGEIHTSLIQGRPGGDELSPELSEFTKARYVRIRLLGFRGTSEPLPLWLAQDIWKDKRLFYSIKDIHIGGQCVCNGHAESCRYNVASGHPECECDHHTCGPNCDRCCPMYNQRQWGPGSSRDGRQCIPCNCNGHSNSCHYDEDVDKNGLSMDVNGNYQGGGVCDNCTDHTTGINCELCKPGYFRPKGTTACIKCDCDPLGSSENCIQYGDNSGTCLCLPGFAGEKCDSCESGYRGYPICEVCPCDPKGVIAMNNCDDDCKCKDHVTGKFCDHCKSGYFGLRDDIPNGCLRCVCSGITTICESAIVAPRMIQALKDWLITDLKVTHTIKPTSNGYSVYSMGNYELPGIESLYWLAPEEYLGNKLETYNGNFIFKIQWVVMRGDTSGEAIMGPNIILVGSNGLRIGHGDDIYTSLKMTFNITLNEINWYVIPEDVNDITTTMRKSDYQGKLVTRQEFLSVLSDIKYVLLRSSFHTDQIETLLEEATLHTANEKEGYGSVEKCSCPTGYTGLSCESCVFGYVRIYANTSDNQLQAFCAKCDCNGHSETCNSNTGKCFCQHNTIGEKCERCAPGFYGNPLHGTVNDCKKCACPLENEENNFSPSCQLDFHDGKNSENYVCTQCPKGYTGDHCEICDDGHYGDPTIVGNRCIACDCNGGPCDGKTGQCLHCKGNTEGWKCERCKSEYYGDPLTYNCHACECDPIGSLSKQCDNVTGQCLCKDRFVGRTCNKCQLGYGNVTASCQKCNCNPIGSVSQNCDPRSGTCECHVGVEGFRCDTCQNSHYGFSTSGCTPCNCSPVGSHSTECTSRGQCPCRGLYTGLKCEKCLYGYYITANNTCKKCVCNENGSLDNICDRLNGNCNCKPGVDGKECSTCKKDHYGSIETSCQKCKPCNKPGHICDKENGECVCPVLSSGPNCSSCAANAWGFEPEKGCKACECSIEGSTRQQCDILTGQCTCNFGYEGEKCNRCSKGYYGYPDCRPCKCNKAGSLDCVQGFCPCDKSGECSCKDNVAGIKCSLCKRGTFGLHEDNDKGCIECFCFGRTGDCEEIKLNLEKFRESNLKPIDDNCVDQKKCWKLSTFQKDLTTSYNGYLTVNISGNVKVTMRGNNIEIQSRPNFKKSEIQLIENNWDITNDIDLSCKSPLSRGCLMVLLQNVSEIIIETDSNKIGILKEVLLDVGKQQKKPVNPSSKIESCSCPKNYTSLSCQKPNSGHFLDRKSKYLSSWIDKKIGMAKQCDCNNHSNSCDFITGFCKDCQNHRIGSKCETCEEGFYKDVNGDCSPCLCPSKTQTNAVSCHKSSHGYTCTCKEGYIGNKCDSCADGYYNLNSRCVQCFCNANGALSHVCNKNTGTCQCKSGFKGNKCFTCEKPRHVIDGEKCIPCDECSQKLFKKIDGIRLFVDNNKEIFNDGLDPPWKFLENLTSYADILMDEFTNKIQSARKLVKNNNITNLINQLKSIEQKVNDVDDPQNYVSMSNNLYNKSVALVDDIKICQTALIENIKTLNKIGKTNMKEALHAAKKNLQLIEEKKKLFNSDEYSNTCRDLEQKINKIYNKTISLRKTEKSVDTLKKYLNDQNGLTSNLKRKCDEITNMNDENAEKIKHLQNNIIEINKRNNLTQDDMTKAEKKIQDTKTMLPKIYELNQQLNATNINFDQLKNNFYYDNSDVIDKIDVIKKHVENLQDEVTNNNNIFNYKDENTKKIKASGAYKDIINGIESVRQKMNEVNEIYNKIKNISNSSKDSLTTKALLSEADSGRLLKRIENLKPNNRVQIIDSKIDATKDKLYNYGKRNNRLLQRIQFSKKDATDWSNILKSIPDSENIRNLQKDVNNFEIMKKYSLHKDLGRYKSLTSDVAKNEILKKNSELLENLQNIKKSLIGKKDYAYLFNHTRLDSVRDRIKQLQNQILYAKQAANEINSAMNITKCLRQYQINDHNDESWRSLTIKFKCTTCTLFNTSLVLVTVNKNELNLNINSTKKNRKLTGDIERTLKLQFNDVNEEEIENNRIINFYSNEELEVPTDFRVGDESNDATGYISSVVINDNKIGLWNFKSSTGNCLGTSSDTATDKNEKEYFIKDAYKKYGKCTLIPHEFALPFRFETFDENSTIYLAQDSFDLHSFIILRLENGRVVLNVRHIDSTEVELRTKEKYNNGNIAIATISMKFRNDSQTYSLKVNNETSSDVKSLKRPNVFKIKKAMHYVGGVDPIFNRSTIPFPIPYSFQGHLKHPPKFERLEMEYGTVPHHNLQYRKAWFNNTGCLRLQNPIKEFHSIRFKIKPLSTTGVIINLSKFIYLQINSKYLNLYYSNNKSEHLSFNILQINKIELNKTHFTVNDNSVQRNLPINNSFDITLGCRLSKQFYTGGIYDLYINNMKFPFNSTTIKDFENVQIGREYSLPKNEMKMLTSSNNFMQNTERCAPTNYYVTDKSAVKFGDKPNSYIYLSNQFWKKDYKFKMEFRTFYPNGLLFISKTRARNNNLNYLELQKGKIQLYIKSKRKKTLFSHTVNDGQWHSLQISSGVNKKKRVIITLDNNSNNFVSIPRNIIRGEMFLGGIPPAFNNYVQTTTNKLLPFRGCMRSVEINGEQQEILDSKNIGQCFPNIEEGAYFTGDSYAIYKNKFEVRNILELGFQFRTAEQNGILLIMSHYQNNIIFSIELQSGAIVMTVDGGNGVISKVVNNLGSEFALCNNNWHNVTAFYSNSELTINIDGITKTWVQSDDNSLMDEFIAPLYIGGLPDTVPAGTLRNKENFKGCIKNIKIENVLMDWTDMEELNNILLNSCPL